MADGAARELLCISCAFRPETWPTANRAAKLLDRLRATWSVRVVTEIPAGPAGDPPGIERITVPLAGPRQALARLARLRLGALAGFFVWPDPEVLWVPRALRAARKACRERRPDAILVFMMPYSSAFVGIALKRLFGVPLVLNLDDSPTCSDMHTYASPVHARLAERMERAFIEAADLVVYVSETNRARVAAGLPPRERAKLRLVRYGADRATAPAGSRAEPGVFTVRYLGGFMGWTDLVTFRRSAAKRALRSAIDAARVVPAALDYRAHSPVFVGLALKRLLERRPEWKGRVRIEVFGDRYPRARIDEVLRERGLMELVHVEGLVSNDDAVALAASAEMLFIALPDRLDGSPGGRISAKTYEYLTTDRPILAALPPGENRDFLAGKPGVWLTAPLDEHAMERALEEAALAFFAGTPKRFDRAAVRASVSYDRRAEELGALLDEVLGRAAPKASSTNDATAANGRAPARSST